MLASRPIPSSSSSHIEDRTSDRSDGSLPSDVCVERHDVCFEGDDVWFATHDVFLHSHVEFLDSHGSSFAKHVVFFAPHVVCGDDPSLCFYAHDVCLELHDICRLQSVLLGSRSSLFARKSVLNLEAHVVRRASNVVRRASHVVCVDEDVRFPESNDVGEGRAVVSGLAGDVFEEEDVVCREVESMRRDGKSMGRALSRRSEDTDDVCGEADVVPDAEQRRFDRRTRSKPMARGRVPRESRRLRGQAQKSALVVGHNVHSGRGPLFVGSRSSRVFVVKECSPSSYLVGARRVVPGS
jgi:hypothetical protein